MSNSKFSGGVLQTTLTADLSYQLEQIKKEHERAAKEAMNTAIRRHFHTSQGDTKGPGYIEIEQFIDGMFGTPEMKKRMEEFFESSFASIFEETMKKATAHKVNQFVFSEKAQELTNKVKEATNG